MKDIEQLKSLWKSLFGDTEAFISLFFHEVVREENIRVLEEKGRIFRLYICYPIRFGYGTRRLQLLIYQVLVPSPKHRDGD